MYQHNDMIITMLPIEYILLGFYIWQYFILVFIPSNLRSFQRSTLVTCTCSTFSSCVNITYHFGRENPKIRVFFLSIVSLSLACSPLCIISRIICIRRFVLRFLLISHVPACLTSPTASYKFVIIEIIVFRCLSQQR